MDAVDISTLDKTIGEITSLCPGEPLYLAPRHRATLLKILQEYVPDQDVWAFGSRATGKYLGRFSDLDLAVEKAVEASVRYDLKDALDESMLPIRVDFVELARVDAAFAGRIRPDFVMVRAGSSRGVVGVDADVVVGEVAGDEAAAAGA